MGAELLHLRDGSGASEERDEDGGGRGHEQGHGLLAGGEHRFVLCCCVRCVCVLLQLMELGQSSQCPPETLVIHVSPEMW